jgi:hypothetical protein
MQFNFRMSYNAVREKGTSENNTGCNTVDRAKVRLYLAILDKLRFNKGMEFTPEAANEKRSKDRLELPAGVLPLNSAPIWRELLDWTAAKRKTKEQGLIGKHTKPRAGLVSQAVKDSVFYLLEFLECECDDLLQSGWDREVEHKH